MNFYKLLSFILLWLISHNNMLFSQDKLTFVNSISICSSRSNIIDIDMNSSKKYFSVLIHNNNTQNDSILIYNKANYNIQESYLLESRPFDYSSVIITNKFICFLMSTNEVEIYKLKGNRFLLSNKITVKDEKYIYDDIHFFEDSSCLYISSKQNAYDIRDRGFLKVIKTQIPQTDTVILSPHLVHIKQDSLSFLSLYQPFSPIDISDNGTLGIIDYEGNLSLLKQNNIFKVKLFKSDYTIKDKIEVVSIQRSYNRYPSYDKLDKLDKYVDKHKRSVGLWLSDSLFAVMYCVPDKSTKDGTSISFMTEFYKYYINIKNNDVEITKLFTHLDILNTSGNIFKDTDEIATRIRIFTAKKIFLSSNLFYILEKDILGYMETHKLDERISSSYTRYMKNRDLTHLLIFKAE